MRYVLVAALNRARQFRRRLAAVPASLSCASREQTAGVVAADRVKPLWPIRVMALPVSWVITVERAADSSLQRQP